MVWCPFGRSFTEKHGNSDMVDVLIFLCYDGRVAKSNGLPALPEDDR